MVLEREFKGNFNTGKAERQKKRVLEEKARKARQQEIEDIKWQTRRRGWEY